MVVSCSEQSTLHGRPSFCAEPASYISPSFDFNKIYNGLAILHYYYHSKPQPSLKTYLQLSTLISYWYVSSIFWVPVWLKGLFFELLHRTQVSPCSSSSSLFHTTFWSLTYTGHSPGWTCANGPHSPLTILTLSLSAHGFLEPTNYAASPIHLLEWKASTQKGRILRDDCNFLSHKISLFYLVLYKFLIFCPL